MGRFWDFDDASGYAVTFGTENTRWYRQAACRGLNTELFYDPDFYDDLRPICQKCPVLEECRAQLEREEHTHYRYGFRANTSPRERRRYLDAGRNPTKDSTDSTKQ